MEIYLEPCTDYPSSLITPDHVQARNRQKTQLAKPLHQPCMERRVAALYLDIEGQPAVSGLLLFLKHFQPLEQQAMLVPRDRQLLE